MNDAERVRRLNQIREGLTTNPSIIDDNVGALMCRLDMVIREAFEQLVTFPKKEDVDSMEYGNYDESDDESKEITSEEYNIIKNGFLESLKDDIIISRS
jgi:transaldolase